MALPKTFTGGERLFAKDLNDNFEALDTRLATAEFDIDTNTANFSALNASNLTGGTVPLDRLPTSVKAGIGTNVVQKVTNTSVLVNAVSFQNWSGFNASITPTSASSKVLVILTASTVSRPGVTCDVQVTATSGTSPFGYLRNYSETGEIYSENSVVFLHSPATTSAVTYQVQLKGSSFRGNTGGETSTLTLIEVAA